MYSGSVNWPASKAQQPSARLCLSIRSAEDVALRRHHHVVEVLSEHRSREEGDGAQCFVADIDEVMFYRRWNRKNTARTNPVGAAIFHVQFAGTSNDVLRFFGSIVVPGEAMSWLNFIYDRRRCGRAVAAIDGKGASPMN